MPLSIRGNRQYYYESVRIDGQPTKLYRGTGRTAEMLSGIAEVRLANRKLAKLDARDDEAHWQHLEGLVDEFHRIVELIVRVRLCSLGYHRPTRHAWRQKRGATKTNPKSTDSGRDKGSA